MTEERNRKKTAGVSKGGPGEKKNLDKGTKGFKKKKRPHKKQSLKKKKKESGVHHWENGKSSLHTGDQKRRGPHPCLE